MNMQTSTFGNAAAYVVNGPKCRTPIPIQSWLQHDAIIQTILDPGVRSIEFASGLPYLNSRFDVNAVIVRGNDRTFVIDIPGLRPARSVDEEAAFNEVLHANGISLRIVDHCEIIAEPRFSNAREIWTCRNANVPLSDRFRIMTALAEEGPLSIFALQEFVRTSIDLATAVCALACADLVEIDQLSGPIGPKTSVRCRS